MSLLERIATITLAFGPILAGCLLIVIGGLNDLRSRKRGSKSTP